MSGSKEDAGVPGRRKLGRPRLDAQMVPAILDAAERLFAAHDALNVSIRDIAAAAGLPHPAIYRYFHSKEDIFKQVLMRGRARQRERDVTSRETDDALMGAVDWLMTVNRGYMNAVARAAMGGATPSSLGLKQSHLIETLTVLEEEQYPFELKTDYDPKVILAAMAALSLGWAVGEDWVVDAVGLEGRDISAVRDDISTILGSLMAMARNGGGATG